MKESCLHLFIYWTYLFGGTFALFYRAMDKDSKTIVTNPVNQSTAPFNAFGQKMQQEIARAKIKSKICGIIKDLCKQQPPKTIVKRIKPPETSPSPNVPTPNINISLVFSEPSEHSNDTTCMKFRLPEDSSSGKIVTGADIFVYIKNRKKRSLNKKGRKKRRRKRMRKISIKISLLNEENRHKKFVSRLRFRPDLSKKWYKLVLPYWIIKKANKKQDRALNLCIECKRCKRNIQVILPLKTSIRIFKFIEAWNQTGKGIPHKKYKKMKSLRLRKNRPFLICHRSEKTHQRRRRETIQCDKNNPYSQCCRHQEYIRFSDIGLGDRVTYPDGFYKTQCIGSCSSNSSRTDLALTQCTPSSYKPFKTVLVFDSDVMYLDIPQGNIQECACQ